jgi:DNA-nicking Smr family endonuclease
VKKRADKNQVADVPRPDDASDADAFTREMADVVRLVHDPRGRIRPARRISAPPAASPPTDLVEGTDEDFTADGVDRREIRKLKRGDYTVEGRLDLHGRTAADACPDVRRFVEQSRRSRHRCVAIVHGRGLHSEGRASILKPRVRACLRSLQSVLAFSDAPRSDGGAGAVYVLLRR